MKWLFQHPVGWLNAVHIPLQVAVLTYAGVTAVAGAALVGGIMLTPAGVLVQVAVAPARDFVESIMPASLPPLFASDPRQAVARPPTTERNLQVGASPRAVTPTIDDGVAQDGPSGLDPALAAESDLGLAAPVPFAAFQPRQLVPPALQPAQAVPPGAGTIPPDQPVVAIDRPVPVGPSVPAVAIALPSLPGPRGPTTALVRQTAAAAVVAQATRVAVNDATHIQRAASVPAPTQIPGRLLPQPGQPAASPAATAPPTAVPTTAPTAVPTSAPTAAPTTAPASAPTPGHKKTALPTPKPTPVGPPTQVPPKFPQPTARPTYVPVPAPTRSVPAATPVKSQPPMPVPTAAHRNPVQPPLGRTADPPPPSP